MNIGEEYPLIEVPEPVPVREPEKVPEKEPVPA